MDDLTKEKTNLLMKACWNTSDIIKYFPDYSVGKAFRLKERAIKEFDGAVPYGSNFAKVESIMNVLGTTIKEQLLLLGVRNEEV